jgi:TldD protein
LEAVSKGSADYIDVRFEEGDQTSVHYRRDRVEGVSSSSMHGGIVRACHKGGWGVTTFDALSDLQKAVDEATACARLVGTATTELAEVEGTPRDVEIYTTFKEDYRGVGLDEKIDLVREYNDILIGHEGVESTDVMYRDGFRTVTFASSRGVSFSEERGGCAMSFSATARDGSLLQTTSDAVRTKDDFNVLRGQHALVDALGQRAADLLRAPPCPGGTFTVVLDPEMAGVFMHEAFGHLSEADHIYEDDKLRQLVYLGREVGPQELNVIDDGTLPDLPGTTAYDDEGTPPNKTYLIREGVLVGYMHTLETAGKMGCTPTGNARAGARGHPPLVRMTNTIIENGPRTRDNVFAGIDKGIYACGMFGGNTQLEMFSFSAAYGYLIENGKVGPMIRDVVLAGNVFQTLYSIDAIANDLTIPQRGGMCGKGGQGIAVSLGSPHIRIRDVVVGGAS